jgi:hypothetical protein
MVVGLFPVVCSRAPLFINNILFIPRRPVLLMEETTVPEEIYRLAASHWQTLSHNIVSSSGIQTHNFSSDRH